MCLDFERKTVRRDEIADAQPGTIDWVWSHRSYVEWKEETCSILWIQGKPGSGKSVLAKSILEHRSPVDASSSGPKEALDNDGSLVCDWFYSTRGGADLMAHQSLMQSLLYQMLSKRPSLFRHFKRQYRRYPPLSKEWVNLDALEEILTQIAAARTRSICVVDAM